MNGAIERALSYFCEQTPQKTDGALWPMTLNFHPDVTVGERLVVERMAEHRRYRSQFETETISGDLTAHRGGERWKWQSRLFGPGYDTEAPAFRPKYGAINHRNDPVGASRRFEFSHFRLRLHVSTRMTFCYPDSQLEPQNFATSDVRPLIALSNANELSLDPWLDNYVEAHIHGPLIIAEDFDALVLDPSFKGTNIEEAAALMRCPVEWHSGFSLSIDRI